MKEKKLLLGCSAFLVFGTTVVYGGSCDLSKMDDPAKSHLFNATLCVDGDVKQAGKNKAEDFFNQFQNTHLRELFDNYEKDTSPGAFKLDFRGLSMTVAYPKKGETLLTFDVPALGIHKKFCPNAETIADVCSVPGTRDETNERFKEYLKKNGDQLLTKSTESTPHDAVAGNSTSLETLMVRDQFTAGIGSNFGRQDRQLRPSLLGTEFRWFESQKVDNKSTRVLDMPFSYLKPLEGDSELRLRLPISYTEVEGASSYLMMPSVSYKTPVLADNSWFLTPSLGSGIVGSTDLWSAGVIMSTALTSDLLLFRQSNYTISMGNMVGYYRTLPLDIKGYKTPDLSNTMVRNGLLLSVPLRQKLAGMDLMAETYVIDTRAFGSTLYERYYNEVGITIGPDRMSRLAGNQSRQAFGIGVSYIRANHSHGFDFSVGYEF